jgi:hypothetical protein
MREKFWKCQEKTWKSANILLPTNSLLFKIWNIKIYIKTHFYGQSHVSVHADRHRGVFIEPGYFSLTLHTSQHTHHNLTHMLPQYHTNYNDIIYWFYLQKSNFGQAQYRPPDDGPHGPKHVAVTVKKRFNVNCNILYVK